LNLYEITCSLQAPVHAACLGLNRQDAIGNIDASTLKRNALAVLCVCFQGRLAIALTALTALTACLGFV